jgi:ABC-type branched-subunit amino acid transport system substrate-binding protein
MVRFVDIVALGPQLRSFAERHAARSGHELTDEAPLTYDAIGLVAAAMRQGATDREGIRRYLDSLSRADREYPGITGGIRFDADGNAPPSYFLLELTSTGSRSAN